MSLYGIGGTNEGRIGTFGGGFPIEIEEDVTVAEAGRETFES